MTTIVESQPTTADSFASAVGGDATIVPNLDALKRHLGEASTEYAVILGPGVDLEAAAALADTLRVTRPAISVILVRRRIDTSVLAEALRSGMREVVEERDLSGLAAASRRAAQVWEALNGPIVHGSALGTGKQITVFSPKGGVGKTTLAVNLALALSDVGKQRVCLVDLDLAFGDVAITLQLFPARTLADAIPLESGLDASVLETILTPYRENLYALVAPVQPDAMESIPASLVAKVLTILKTSFDYVVVDTAPSFDEQVLQALDGTDTLLLVTTLDVPTIKNIKIAAETLDLLNFPTERRHLVLNRADDKVGLSADKVENTLGMKINVSIPSSPHVASSTNSGEPIYAALPRHAVSRAVAALAGELCGVATPDVPEKSNRAASRRPLFHRSR